MDCKILNANIVTAFGPKTIGTKVTQPATFMALLKDSVLATDFAAQRQPGQAFIKLPDLTRLTVSAGVGLRTTDPENFVLREHRGVVSAFLKREHAAEVEGVAAVVYTVEAYLADPDVSGDAAEVERIKEGGATHILVAVLAFAGPQAPLGPGRLVHNLAGGNREAALWSADEIRTKAAESSEYWKTWATVAD